MPAAPHVDGRARQRKDHQQRLCDEREEQRRFDRLADLVEIEREGRLAHAEAVHRHRQQLHDERHRHDDGEIRERDVEVQRVRDREVEHHHGALDEERAAEAAEERARLVAEAGQRAGQLRDAVADPFRVKHRQRPQQTAEAGGGEHGRRRRGGAGEEPGPQPDRPDRCRGVMQPPDRGRANRRHEHERHQAEHAIHQDDGRRERFRVGDAPRVPDTDDVAADVARQKIVEVGRDQKRAEQRRPGDLDALRLEQEVPAPHRRHRADGVDGQCGEQPRDRRQPGSGPQLRDVDPRKEHDEEDDADRELHRQQDVAAHGGRFGLFRGHSAKGTRHCTIIS